MIKTYYNLTKPGIIYGNALTAAAGFFLAARGTLNILLLIAMLLGTALIMASACVFNNLIDRDIDAKMKRTQQRALVLKTISARSAIIYATVLGLAGVSILAAYTNPLTVYAGLFAFFFYVVVYGVAKRASIHGTIIGSISGSMPPVGGYLAVTNHIDAGAILLFLILTFWQMPHFYAISIYRLRDYAAAGIPVLPVKKGVLRTKWNMLFYTIAFLIAVSLLTVFGYTGITYLIVMSTVGFFWLHKHIAGFWATDNDRWARSAFKSSLIILPLFALLLFANVVLP